jgi:hypothetical protein
MPATLPTDYFRQAEAIIHDPKGFLKEAEARVRALIALSQADGKRKAERDP